MAAYISTSGGGSPGSSRAPLENYELEIPDAVSPRKIVPAMSLLVDEDGNVSEKKSTDSVAFRDREGLIHPVAPFFELWAQMEGSEEWVPLSKCLLEANGLNPNAVRWKVSVGNHKIFRRTSDPNDRIDAVTDAFRSSPVPVQLGECQNFLDDERLPLGFVQYPRPSDEFPETRLRFTPAHGKVYGSASIESDPFVVKALYDPNKGHWNGYQEPYNPNNDYEGRRLTNPAQIFAGYDTPNPTDAQFHVGYGYVDDECDGVIEATLTVGQKTLTAFARVAAGPPTFAPDGKPIRTVADELEQTLFGPEATASHEEIGVVRDIVRRALETVRLMNTGQMNKGQGPRRGHGANGHPRVRRKSEPIFDADGGGSLAHPHASRTRAPGARKRFACWFRAAHSARIRQSRRPHRRRPPQDARHDAQRRRPASRAHAAPGEQGEAVAEYIARMDQSRMPARACSSSRSIWRRNWNIAPRAIRPTAARQRDFQRLSRPGNGLPQRMEADTGRHRSSRIAELRSRRRARRVRSR